MKLVSPMNIFLATLRTDIDLDTRNTLPDCSGGTSRSRASSTYSYQATTTKYEVLEALLNVDILR